ncbi:MAG TPA: preprotein translocase subunit YajC [bacterium]|nr:preprotein translocase subunit YajC [bacterium]HPS28958.1 preprotein translocase subunit YajC [bacterium]
MNSNMLKLLGDLTITQTAGQGGGMIGILNMLLPFILIFAIFYFLVILPQKKQQKKHLEMLNQLQKGEIVLMNCGIKGRISEIKENEIKLEISPKVIVTIQKGVISSKVAGNEEI